MGQQNPTHNPRHADYLTRPQPDRDERDMGILTSHIHDLAEEIELAGGSAALELQATIDVLNEKLADVYIKAAGVPAEAHQTHCAILQAPAFRPGPCDCGAGAPSSG